MKNLQIFRPLPQLRELNLLQELEKTPIVSQRELAIRSGIALGATNNCLKRMAEREWIQMKGMNGHRMAYYLTTKGISEKNRLASEMVSRAIEHYVWIKGLMREKLLEMQNAGVRRIALYGVGDEMEIAYTTLQEFDLKLVGITEDEEMFGKVEVRGFKLTPVEHIKELDPEGILVTSLSRMEERMKKLEKYIETSAVKILCV